MILNKKIQNQTSKQAKKKKKHHKTRIQKMQKWTKKNEIVNASSCAKMNNIHAVLEQMYLN